MRRLRNVKIVATLGPASSDRQTIRALFEAGADVFRLNMSHGDHAEIGARHRMIREVEEETGRPIAILADLQGPKLRCGTFAEGAAELVEGQTFRLDLDDRPGDAERVQVPHREIFEALEPGATLLINDGKIRLRVREAAPDHAITTVEVGGTISNRKGVNVPDVVLPLAALSDKDRRDLDFVCELGVDWLALSFVQRAEDVFEARELAAGRAAILSKIEKPAAVRALHELARRPYVWVKTRHGVSTARREAPHVPSSHDRSPSGDRRPVRLRRPARIAPVRSAASAHGAVDAGGDPGGGCVHPGARPSVRPDGA